MSRQRIYAIKGRETAPLLRLTRPKTRFHPPRKVPEWARFWVPRLRNSCFPLRLQKAQELLRGTEKSVLDIARETGFGASSYLCKLFKQKRHITPNQYRGYRRERRSPGSEAAEVLKTPGFTALPGDSASGTAESGVHTGSDKGQSRQRT